MTVAAVARAYSSIDSHGQLSLPDAVAAVWTFDFLTLSRWSLFLSFCSNWP